MLPIQLSFFQILDSNSFSLLAAASISKRKLIAIASKSDNYNKSNLEKKQRTDTKNEAKKIKSNMMEKRNNLTLES